MSKIDDARGAHLEEMLDWLAEEVAQRLRSANTAGLSQPDGPSRASGIPQAGDGPSPAPGAQSSPGGSAQDREAPAVQGEAGKDSSPISEQNLAASLGPGEERRLTGIGAEDSAESRPGLPQPQAGASRQAEPAAGIQPSNTTRLMSRLAVGLLAAVILINIPLGAHGTALARAIPGSASLVIRNGLLVEESDRPDVYVYQDGKFRWITDLEAFVYYGYRWQNVRQVEPGFLADYEIGTPLSMVAKCPDSPHVYRLTSGTKQWIVDIPTFVAEGYQWSDVRIMDCHELRRLPMGETIPPGRGPAPQP